MKYKEGYSEGLYPRDGSYTKIFNDVNLKAI